MHHHRFYVDEEERRKWQDPVVILNDIGLRSGLVFIDVGCGDGFFTLPAARIVGKEGIVYAVDLNAEAIDLLRQKASREELTNVRAEVGTAEDTVFCHACADIVFYSIVLHDFRDPSRALLNARTMLKPDGRVVDLDWKKKPMDFGPPLRIRFSEEYAARLIENAGFKVERRKDKGFYHYVISAVPE